jgi:hypothetical protein
MGETLQGQLTALEREVRAALIPGDWRHTADWRFELLPSLYDKLRQTNDSRYGEEISRRVLAVLRELANSTKKRLEAQKLAVHITERLCSLHEEFGLPGLVLRLPATRPARSTTAG